MRYIVLVLAIALSVSCSEVNSPRTCGGCNEGQSYTPPLSTFIDEPLLMSASDVISPTVTDGDVFIFDLTGVPEVQDHSFNDMEVSYTAPSSCDEDVWLFNWVTFEWDKVDDYYHSGCMPAVCIHHLLLSDVVLDPTLYVSETFDLKMLGPAVWEPTVRVLRIHPDYCYVPLPVDASGLAFGCGVLWIAGRFSPSGALHNYIYTVSMSGEVLGSFPAPSRYAFDLDFDGDYLWLADGSDSVYQMTTVGDVVCRFGVATDYPGGLAKADGEIWLSEYERLNRVPGKIYHISLDSSCRSGNAAVLDSLDIPGKWSRSLAWTGASLLVASDSLYELNPSGIVGRTYPIPVSSVQSIAWDGTGVWMLCFGPRGASGGARVAARFNLR